MDLPPEPTIRALIERLSRILEGRRDEIGERPMVLPTSELFPDAFTADQPSIERLVQRMQAHAGMNDIPIQVRLIAPEGDDDPEGMGSCCGGDSRGGDSRGGDSRGGDSCGGDSCCTSAPTAEGLARLIDNDDSWTLNVPAAEVGSPVALTANIARALGLVFLKETEGDAAPLDEPSEVSADLTAVLLGFGELLLEGSYIYKKSCCGPSIATVTALGTAELALAFALFSAMGGHSLKPALRELGATQRAVLSEARDWTRSNPALVEALKRTPGLVAIGHYELEETRPWLLRALGSKKKTPGETSIEELEAALAAEPPPRKAPKVVDPEQAELKELVAEALSASRQ